jgi:hypothetical protein
LEGAVNEDALVARIARLEAVARRDRTFALGSLVVLLATAQTAPVSGPISVAGASGSATIAAAGLVVRDASKIVRQDVGLDSNGYPSLDFQDAAGNLREAMYLLNDRPILRQFDSTRKRRAEAFLSATGNGEFSILDAAENTRLNFFQGDKDLPEFALYGSDAKARAYISSDDAGPFLVMKDGNGNTRLDMGTYTGGSVGLDVRNAAGTTLFSKP